MWKVREAGGMNEEESEVLNLAEALALKNRIKEPETDRKRLRTLAEGFQRFVEVRGLAPRMEWERSVANNIIEAVAREPPAQGARPASGPFRMPADILKVAPSLKELDELVGLTSVKKKIVEDFASIVLDASLGVAVPKNRHAIFFGNPGTVGNSSLAARHRDVC